MIKYQYEYTHRLRGRTFPDTIVFDEEIPAVKVCIQDYALAKIDWAEIWLTILDDGKMVETKRVFKYSEEGF